MQEALLAASVQWPRDGMPGQPAGVADHRRRAPADRRAAQRGARRRREEVATARDEPLAPSRRAGRRAADADDTLRLLFLCCHPALTPPSQVALTLRAVGGLTTAEIAAAFLVPEATMAQRISRAKQKMQATAPLRDAAAGERAERLRSVLHVLYLVFNEGYTASSGPASPARPHRRGDPPDPRRAPAAARRRRGRRAAGADAAHRGPPADARRHRRGAGAARRAGPRPLGPGAHRRGRRPGRRATLPRRPDRAVPGAGRDRRGARRGAVDRRHRLAADPRALRRARADRPQPDGDAQPGRRGGDGRRAARPGWPCSTRWTPTGRSATTTASPPCGPTCSSWPATPAAARDEYRRAARLTTSRPEQRYLDARARRLAAAPSAVTRLARRAAGFPSRRVRHARRVIPPRRAPVSRGLDALEGRVRPGDR